MTVGSVVGDVCSSSRFGVPSCNDYVTQCGEKLHVVYKLPQRLLPVRY